MLNKNIFFLYTAGYCGNYLQWTVNVSERDTAPHTIKEPLLPDSTTHGFMRFPTHISIRRVQHWMILKKPSKPQTYIVNCYHDDSGLVNESENAVAEILLMCPDALIVNIHAGNAAEKRYGALNTYTKWPHMFDASPGYPQDYYDFDHRGHEKPYTMRDRNWFYNHWKKRFPQTLPLSYKSVQDRLNITNAWYDARHPVSPWEVDQDNYVVMRQIPKEQILDVRLAYLMQPDFFDKTFVPWIEDKKVGHFDWQHVLQYHDRYIAAQKNMAINDTINKMDQNKTVDAFCMQNALTQAMCLGQVSNLQDVPHWYNRKTTDIFQELDYHIE